MKVRYDIICIVIITYLPQIFHQRYKFLDIDQIKFRRFKFINAMVVIAANIFVLPALAVYLFPSIKCEFMV